MAWCYVDPDECGLQNARSRFFPEAHRYYSYATCHYPDMFTNDLRLLSGLVINVGLTHNKAGWRGSFSNDTTNFEGPLNKWSGTSVGLLRQITRLGNVTFRVTQPPSFLRDNARAFYNGAFDDFDLCVYATSLGFLTFVPQSSLFPIDEWP